MDNIVSTTVQHQARLYLGISLKDCFFKSYGINRQSNKNYCSKISEKFLFWAEWEAFCQLLSKIIQAYILGSAKTIATKLISLIGNTESIKVTGVEILKPDVQFRPNCGPKLLKLESQYLL